jgi:membrane protease YdiL (CAAX protease family)
MHFALQRPRSLALSSTRPAIRFPGRALLAVAALATASVLDTRTLMLLVVAPVLEELVFRAGLHEALLRREAERSPPAALTWPNLITALLFGAAHVALRPGLAGALTVLPAFAVGACYERRRRLLPCIALHAAFNALWLLLPAARLIP